MQMVFTLEHARALPVQLSSGEQLAMARNMCVKEVNVVTIQAETVATGYRKICRSCRLKRCMDIGMLPDNVQHKDQCVKAHRN
ncbi:hypothetical protein NECAME_17355, partial [Necator americanus]